MVQRRQRPVQRSLSAMASGTKPLMYNAQRVVKWALVASGAIFWGLLASEAILSRYDLDAEYDVIAEEMENQQLFFKVDDLQGDRMAAKSSALQRLVDRLESELLELNAQVGGNFYVVHNFSHARNQPATRKLLLDA
jgi:hypothetical protein